MSIFSSKRSKPTPVMDWKVEAISKGKEEAVGKPSTHLVRWNGEDVRAYIASNGVVILPYGWGPVMEWEVSVLEILLPTEEQRRNKEVLFELFEKMMASPKATSKKSYAGMGSEWWYVSIPIPYRSQDYMLGVFGGRSWRWMELRPDGPKCELTSAEANSIRARIEERQNQLTDPKEIEALL